jgi:uncharacterized membrane protein YdbT with pleckstrin-like domain
VGYAEEMLASNERIVYRTKQHWIAPIYGTIAGSLLLIGGVLLFLFQLTLDTEGAVGFLRTIAFWGALIMVVVGVVMVGYSYIRWWVEDYFVTNQKVMKVEGLLNKKTSGAALEKINDIVLAQGVIGRTLNYGDLRVMTASDDADLSYRTMRSPGEFRRRILDEKLEFERSDAREIASAVRAASAPPPAAPAPAPAAPAPAAAPPSADEVTNAIARLAELRDSGAITPEEYEAKKAELLAKL